LVAFLGHCELQSLLAPLKLKAALACRVGQGFHPSVIAVVASVKRRFGDAFRFRLLGQLLPDGGRGFEVAAACFRLSFAGVAAGGGKRYTAKVVDQLGVNVLVAPEDRQARPFLRADDAPADVQPAAKLPLLFEFLLVHEIPGQSRMGDA
jgi:hypothetical protein